MTYDQFIEGTQVHWVGEMYVSDAYNESYLFNGLENSDCSPSDIISVKIFTRDMLKKWKSFAYVEVLAAVTGFTELNDSFIGALPLLA